MDEASDGVIFFSMGTHLRITQMPVSTVEAFLKTFSELKQRIIWKFENDTLPRPAENVKVDKFLPQFDILSKFTLEVEKYCVERSNI
jgi:glucuronosyltransferase